MNVLSLFDGVSCGQLALERAGIKVDNYWASEIDSHAIEIAKKNFPETIHMGDIRDLDWTKVGGPKIDLIIAGSPCTGFSFAGKQLNFNDPQSSLFFEFTRLLNLIKPKYFLLENVKMKKAYQDVITRHLGIEPIEINSALVSAHNRKRLYWTNIPNITQPKDEGVLFKDILEIDGECVNYSSSGRGKDRGVESRITEGKKALTLTASGYSKRAISCISMASLPDDFLSDKPFDRNNMPTINRSTFVKDTYFINDETFRTPTILEKERLQTLPDGYTEGAPLNQRSKMIGNGWTVDVISHILKGIKK